MQDAGSGLQALYSGQVRLWAGKVRADRRLATPDASLTRGSRICGSTITLDIQYQGNTVIALGYRTRACTLGMASTAVIVHIAPGRSFEEIERVGQQLAGLLAGADADFPPGWEILEMFSAARSFTSRHAAILLPFDILKPPFQSL